MTAALEINSSDLANEFDTTIPRTLAGSAAVGHGILTGWEGRGEMTMARARDLAMEARIPAQWMLKSKEVKTQLSRALHAVAGNRYHREQTDKTKKSPFLVQWRLETRTDSEATIEVGKAAPKTTALIATLVTDDPESLSIESTNPALATELRAEFKRRLDDEVFQATDITKWLRDDIMIGRLDCVQAGLGIYAPRASASHVEWIVETFRRNWGSRWTYPCVPYATGPQLAMTAAIALQLEVESITNEITKARSDQRAVYELAVKAKPDTRVSADIGSVAAETFMLRLRGTLARVVKYSNIMKADEDRDLVEETKNVVHDAMITLDGILEGAVDFETEWTRTAMEMRASVLE